MKSDLSSLSLDRRSYIKAFFLKNHSIFMEVRFFSKKALFRVGLYDENMLVYEDIELLLRLLLAGEKFTYVPFPTYIYKIHKASLTQSAIGHKNKFMKEFLLKHEQALLRLDPEFRDILAEKWWDLGRQYFYYAKDFKEAFGCFLKSMSLSLRPMWKFIGNRVGGLSC